MGFRCLWRFWLSTANTYWKLLTWGPDIAQDSKGRDTTTSSMLEHNREGLKRPVTMEVPRCRPLRHVGAMEITDWLTDWLTDWPTDYLTDWLTDWLTNWLTNWLIDWLAELLTYWLTDWLTYRLADWLTNWLTDWLTDWLIERLTDCLTGWLTDWLTDWRADWLTDWLTGWLTDWLTDWRADWLIDWLTDWLTDCDWLQASSSPIPVKRKWSIPLDSTRESDGITFLKIRYQLDKLILMVLVSSLLVYLFSYFPGRIFQSRAVPALLQAGYNGRDLVVFCEHDNRGVSF